MAAPGPGPWWGGAEGEASGSRGFWVRMDRTDPPHPAGLSLSQSSLAWWLRASLQHTETVKAFA